MGIKIERPCRGTKSKVVSLRLTTQEQETLDRLKKDLKFDSIRSLFLFSISALDQLYEWSRSNHAFFIGNSEKGEYRQVEFEFEPGFGE